MRSIGGYCKEKLDATCGHSKESKGFKYFS